MVETENQTIGRYKGTVVGAAVGDALGAPVEFLSADEIKKEYGVIDEMIGGGFFKWKPGETTDDTDNTLCIIDSLIENEKYVPEDIANRLLNWYESKPVDIGTTTATSLYLLKEGFDWQESGKAALLLEVKVGNGSLMRTAPIGLYFRGHKDDIDKAAEEISAITHADPDCIVACQLASQLVSILASGKSKDDSVSYLKELYNGEREEILVKALDGEYSKDKFGWALNTLGIALDSFLSANSFEEAVESAIAVGHDTDTQATVAGAFAGAFWGIEAIPDKWKSKLNPHSATELEEKAEKLYNLNKTTLQMGE